MRIAEIIAELEKFAPLLYQEDYDNSGLLCGDKNQIASGVLLSLDCTEEVIEDAVKHGCNLVIAHHPIIFGGLKKLTGSTHVERTVIAAIRAGISIYACHTNLDNVQMGVNRKICEKLGLIPGSVLSVKSGSLQKLVTYVPESHRQQVMDAVFAAGAGSIGNYEHCSFYTEGTGTFRGNEKTTPFLGKPGEISFEKEQRLETVFPVAAEAAVISALLKAHPYEEVAYDVFPITNAHQGIGAGMVGELKEPLSEDSFMQVVKETFRVPVIKHTQKTGKSIKKVAVCGGSGRFLLKKAIQSGADAYITADFKYHEYFEVEGKLLLIDVGHFESEQFTPEIFYEIIKKKFPTFAVRLSETNTNPINYF